MILTACLCGTGIAICEIISPDEKFSKQINFILSLVFVTGIMTPFADILKSFSDEEDVFLSTGIYEDYSNTEEVYNEYLRVITEENIEKSVKNMLENKKISVYKISVGIDISESSCISISNIGLKCSDFSEAYDIITSEITEECEIWEIV